MKAMFRVVALLLMTQLMLSCSFDPPIRPDDPESIISGIRIGNEVVIVSHKGRISRFVVNRVTNKALYGEGYRVGFDEIKSIEVEGRGGIFSKIF